MFEYFKDTDVYILLVSSSTLDVHMMCYHANIIPDTPGIPPHQTVPWVVFCPFLGLACVLFCIPWAGLCHFWPFLGLACVFFSPLGWLVSLFSIPWVGLCPFFHSLGWLVSFFHSLGWFVSFFHFMSWLVSFFPFHGLACVLFLFLGLACVLFSIPWVGLCPFFHSMGWLVSFFCSLGWLVSFFSFHGLACVLFSIPWVGLCPFSVPWVGLCPFFHSTGWLVSFFCSLGWLVSFFPFHGLLELHLLAYFSEGRKLVFNTQSAMMVISCDIPVVVGLSHINCGTKTKGIHSVFGYLLSSQWKHKQQNNSVVKRHKYQHPWPKQDDSKCH